MWDKCPCCGLGSQEAGRAPARPSGTKGQVAMLVSSSVVLDKCPLREPSGLWAKGPPAGSPRQARRFESAGSGPGGKGRMGIGGGDLPPFSTQT